MCFKLSSQTPTKKAIIFLKKIINGCLRKGYFPKTWKTAIIITILKPYKDHTKPDNSIYSIIIYSSNIFTLLNAKNTKIQYYLNNWKWLVIKLVQNTSHSKQKIQLLSNFKNSQITYASTQTIT